MNGIDEKERKLLSRRRFSKYILALSGLLGLSTLILGSSSVKARKVTYLKKLVINVKEVPPGTSKTFSYPYSDINQRDFTGPCILIHHSSGELKAYSAICTHLRCTVHHEMKENENWIECNCHGGRFDSQTGDVLKFPPKKPLPEIVLKMEENGDIYAVDVLIRE